MEHLIIIAIAALVTVVVLTLLGKRIRMFGLQISWRDGMKFNLENFKKNEDWGHEKKQEFPRLDELQNPWDRTTNSLPVQKDPPPNNLTGKQFMDDDYTSALLSSLKQNIQEGDKLDFDDGL